MSEKTASTALPADLPTSNITAGKQNVDPRGQMRVRGQIRVAVPLVTTQKAGRRILAFPPAA
jgi:hypothetical protein